MSDITQEQLDNVLDFCNKVRLAGGAEPLEGLLPALPSKSKKCLIARALNFSCEVRPAYEPTVKSGKRYRRETSYPDGDRKWYMFVNDEQTLRKIAEVTGQPLELVCGTDYDYNTIDSSGPTTALLLPRELGEVANNYDRWWTEAMAEVCKWVSAPGDNWREGKYVFNPDAFTKLKASPYWALVEADERSQRLREVESMAQVKLDKE